MALPCFGKPRNQLLSPRFLKRLLSWLVLSTVLTLGAACPAKATNLYWDPDGNPSNNVLTVGNLFDGEGGAGTWGTSSSVWDNPSTGLEQVWNNANDDTAVFAGTISGAPTVQAGGITVGGLDFVGGMVFTGGPLTFGGTTANVTLDWPVGETVTINSNLAGAATA